MDTNEKSVERWTRKELSELPERPWNTDIGFFDSLIIFPTRHIHDSGFRCMDFIAVIRGKPICRLSGCSDVIHIDGIGGMGYKWLEKSAIERYSLPPKGWSIDCLKTSGLLRIFSDDRLLSGPALSSFELFSVKKSPELKK